MRTTNEHKATGIFIVLLMLVGIVIPSRSYAAVWVGGSEFADQTGVYGTQGIADASNWPGGRNGGVLWYNSNGSILWSFGGYGYDSNGDLGYLNGFWKYIESTGKWTWLSGSNNINQTGVYGTKGVADVNNTPGARKDCTCWYGKTGQIILFGGRGYDSNGVLDRLNDLWEYTSTGKWVWKSGSNETAQPGVYGTQGVADGDNVPGARANSVSWVDVAGNLWLLGGHANATGVMNDLWKHHVLWTWMSGSSSGGQWGVYGTQGIADENNVPGARQLAVTWTDYDNNQLWLFGGLGYDKDGNYNKLNDMWSYDISTDMWTWQSGSDTVNQLADYGTQGVADVNNIPGSRQGAVGWTDDDGYFWMLGGNGYNASGIGILNDLWKYNISTGMWIWIAGSDLLNQAGSYGAQGVADASNWPGARYPVQSSGPGIDRNSFWLFGGLGRDSIGSSSGYLNDLWKFSCDNPIGDLNDDCIVDLSDMAVLSNNWLKDGDIE